MTRPDIAVAWEWSLLQCTEDISCGKDALAFESPQHFRAFDELPPPLCFTLLMCPGCVQRIQAYDKATSLNTYRVMSPDLAQVAEQMDSQLMAVSPHHIIPSAMHSTSSRTLLPQLRVWQCLLWGVILKTDFRKSSCIVTVKQHAAVAASSVSTFCDIRCVGLLLYHSGSRSSQMAQEGNICAGSRGQQVVASAVLCALHRQRQL